MIRTGHVARTTAETDIDLTLCLEGSGKTSVATGFGLLDHMLTLTAFWAGFDLSLTARAIRISMRITPPKTSPSALARRSLWPWATGRALPAWGSPACRWTRRGRSDARYFRAPVAGVAG